MLNSRKLLGKMAEMGYSQRKLAKAVGMSENTMSSRMTGQTPFDTDEIDNICNELHITDNYEKINIFLWQPSQNRNEMQRSENETLCS